MAAIALRNGLQRLTPTDPNLALQLFFDTGYMQITLSGSRSRPVYAVEKNDVRRRGRSRHTETTTYSTRDVARIVADAGEIDQVVLIRVRQPQFTGINRVSTLYESEERRQLIALLLGHHQQQPQNANFPRLQSLNFGSRNLSPDLTVTEDPVSYEPVQLDRSVYLRSNLRPNGHIAALYNYDTVRRLFNGSGQARSPTTRQTITPGDVRRYRTR